MSISAEVLLLLSPSYLQSNMASPFDFLRKPCSEYTDEELAAMIRAGGESAEQAFKCLYKLYFDMVRMSVQYHNLEKDRILEAYGDALLALRVSVLKDRWQQKGRLRAFFAMIFRNKCIDVIRGNPTNKLDERLEAFLRKEAGQSPENPEEKITAREDEREAEQQANRRKQCLEEASRKLTQREMDILTDYFVKDMSAKELAARHHFKNAGTARTTAYNLKNKLDDSIRSLCKSKPECRVLCP